MLRAFCSITNYRNSFGYSVIVLLFYDNIEHPTYVTLSEQAFTPIRIDIFSGYSLEMINQLSIPFCLPSTGQIGWPIPYMRYNCQPPFCVMRLLPLSVQTAGGQSLIPLH